MRATVPTNLMPQHAFQPVLSGSGDVDGQCGPAVHHRHGSSGQEVVCHLDGNLSVQVKVSATFWLFTFSGYFPLAHLIQEIRDNKNKNTRRLAKW